MKIRTMTSTLVAVLLGGLGWAGSENASQMPPATRLELDLVDGSRIIGIPNIASVPVQTPYAKMDIPLKQVLTVKVEDDHEMASIDLVNGDKVKGVIALQPIELTTVFGPVRIGIESVRGLRVLANGGSPIPETLRKGLVLYYAFDPQAGDVVMDNSGNQHHGGVHGATWSSDGPRGGSMSFDGAGSYIETSDAGLPMGGSPRSIAFWFKLREEGKRRLCEMMRYGTQTANRENGLGMDWRGGRDSIVFSPCGTCFIGATKMTFGRWYHVIYVYGGQGVHKFYVDGRESSGHNELGAIDTLPSGTFTVGAHPQRQQFFDGWMDELMIYDRAVTAAEAEQIYSLGK